MFPDSLKPGMRPAGAGMEETPEKLVAWLLSRLTTPDAHGAGRAGAAENESEEILADVEVEGARYLLVRLPRARFPAVQLSPREQEIVRMVAQGHPNKVIADVLNISSWTVCTYLRRIFAKLGVASRAAMVARLMEVNGGVREAKPGVQRAAGKSAERSVRAAAS